MEPAAQLYLDLLKRCLVNWLYADAETVAVDPAQVLPPDYVAALAATACTWCGRSPLTWAGGLPAATGRRSPTP